MANPCDWGVCNPEECLDADVCALGSETDPELRGIQTMARETLPGIPGETTQESKARITYKESHGKYDVYSRGTLVAIGMPWSWVFDALCRGQRRRFRLSAAIS